MTFIDVHSHLDFYEDKKIKQAFENAKKSGVGIIVNSGIDEKRILKTLEISEKYSEIKASLGIYPIDMLKMNEKKIEEQIKLIIEKAKQGKVIAIGEIGIDLKEALDFEKQKENFKRLIKLALELNLPMIIHSRKAEKECIEILEKAKAKKVIMHCFCGKMSLIQRAVKNNWMFSVPASVNFSEQFQSLVKEVPLSQLLCETDSPFLHPIKGKRNNEPANVIYSYKKIAEIKNISLKECEKQIEENYKRVFR